MGGGECCLLEVFSDVILAPRYNTLVHSPCTRRTVPRTSSKSCSLSPPPPLCNSYALVQATVGVGTVLIWYLI